MSVYKKRNCRNWTIDFQYGGERHCVSSLATTKAEALRREREERLRVVAAASTGSVVHLVSGQQVAAAQAAPTRLSFDQAARRYWDAAGHATENSRPLARQLAMVVELVGRHFDIARLDDERMLLLRAAYSRMPTRNNTKTKGQRAPSTINDVMRLIFRVYKFAVDRCHVRPEHFVDPRAWILPEPVDTRALSLLEEQALEAACDETLRQMAQFAIDTGMREKPLCTLTWGQIDWGARVVTIELKGRGKAKRRHRIHLVDRALDILRDRRDRRDADEMFVFTRPATRRTVRDGNVVEAGDPIPVRSAGFSAEMRRAYRRAGIANATAHTLRHTAAMRLLQVSGSILVVMRFLGHTTLKCTLRYLHLSDSDVQLAQELAAGMRNSVFKSIEKLDPNADDVVRSLEARSAWEKAMRAKLMQNAKKAIRAATSA